MVKHTPMMIEFDMYSKSNMYNRFKKLSSCLGLLQGTGKVCTLEFGYIDKMQYVI
jgi:hypothetical protein